MKSAVYAHKIAKLCSKMCLTDAGLFLWYRCKWSISNEQIRPADGIHELPVLGKSLDSAGCSLSLDSLTET